MVQNVRKYDAFISYRHRENDMAVAEKLQNLLEKQKLREENGKKKRTLQIFRDQSELPTSDNLGKDIRTALENSRFLIVICSEAYQESKWCMEELNYFRSLHGNTNKNILPILLEGEPDEVFPEVLRWSEVEHILEDGSIHTERVEIEPLAADVRALGLRKILKRLKTKEYFRIAAPIMGFSFDDLFQRKKRAHRKMTMAVLFFGMVLSMAFGMYSYYMFKQIADKQNQIWENESIRLADAAMTQLENEDYSLALLLADEAFSFWEKSGNADVYPKAEQAFRSTLFAKRFESTALRLNSKGVISFQTEGFQIICSLDEGKVLQICDGETTYLYETENGQMIDSFLGKNFAFHDDLELYVEMDRIDTRAVCFRGINRETSEVYFSHVEECKPASYYNGFYDKETGDCYLFVDGYLCAFVTADGTVHTEVQVENGEDIYPVSVKAKLEKENYFNNCKDNELCKDESNGLLYQKDKNRLVIYQINENVSESRIIDEGENVFFDISPDGKYCCLMDNHLTDESGQVNGFARIEIYDTENMATAIISEEVQMFDPVSVKYQYSADMSRIIFVDKSGTVYVKNLEQSILWKWDAEECEYIYAVAMEPSGNRVAVAYREKNGKNCITLYDVKEDATSLIDWQKYCDSAEWISCMEIMGNNLLVADRLSLHLFDVDNESYTELSGSAAMAPMQKYLSEDGLLFSMISSDGYDINGNLEYHLEGIYDLETKEYLDIGCAAYDYDISSGFLVYQKMTESGYASTVTVMRRQENGEFVHVWDIRSEKVDMQLLHNGMSLDGDLLLLSGEETCEIYDLSVKCKIMETGFAGFNLEGGLLYHASADKNNKLNCWTVLEETEDLRLEAEQLLNGRVLSEKERSRYYILSQ